MNSISKGLSIVKKVGVYYVNIIQNTTSKTIYIILLYSSKSVKLDRPHATNVINIVRIYGKKYTMVEGNWTVKKVKKLEKNVLKYL